MYIFVRFAAIVTIIFGVLLFAAGLGIAVYGLAQNVALTELLNAAPLSGSPYRLADARFWAILVGLALFIAGVMISAQGQLMLVFVDLANHSRETNVILRGFRGKGQ